MTRRRSAGILLVALLTLGATLDLRVPPAAAIDMNAVAPDLDLPGFKITPFVTERAEFLHFMDMDKQDATHVFLLGKLALNFPGGLSLAVKEDFAHTTDPPGTELTGRIKSTTNVL